MSQSVPRENSFPGVELREQSHVSFLLERKGNSQFKVKKKKKQKKGEDGSAGLHQGSFP